MASTIDTTVPISPGSIELPSELSVPEAADRLIIFSHPFGGLDSPSDQKIAEALNERGFATLRFDMTTDVEEEHAYENVTDWQLLAARIAGVTEWARNTEPTQGLDISYMGASAGAGPMLIAASQVDCVDGAVSRGGMVSLAPHALEQVSNLLLIVGTDDEPFLTINQRGIERAGDGSELYLLEDAEHSGFSDEQFEIICNKAADWFDQL